MEQERYSLISAKVSNRIAAELSGQVLKYWLLFNWNNFENHTESLESLNFYRIFKIHINRLLLSISWGIKIIHQNICEVLG